MPPPHIIIAIRLVLDIPPAISRGALVDASRALQVFPFSFLLPAFSALFFLPSLSACGKYGGLFEYVSAGILHDFGLGLGSLDGAGGEFEAPAWVG